MQHPIAGAPLRSIVRSGERVAVVIPDITRPLPTERLLPWLFAALPHVPPDRIVIVNGTGSHRANTEDELRRMVGPEVHSRYRIVNHDAQDPNRNFHDGSPVGESAALVALLAPLRGRVLMHIDLHETTDTDESEFRPALAARDGEPFVPGEIPDGFDLVDDADHPQPDFQRAVIEAVAQVTHIAEPDANGQIIGCPLQSPGVISFAVGKRALCAAITGARFATTTEVYPDSPRTTPQQCIDAQVAAVRAAIGYALAHVAD